MFDIHKPIFDDYSGDLNEEVLYEYIGELMQLFAESPEGQRITQQFGRISWAGLMIEYGVNYIGVSVPTMSPRDFEEVLFGLFPRKVAAQADIVEAVVAELRAFWEFVYRQYGLDNARRIRDTLTDEATDRLHAEMSNPANFGPGKAIYLMGVEAGYDMTTEAGMQEFMRVHNQSLSQPALENLDDGVDPLIPDTTPQQERDKKRKARKAQRQAKKRNRK